MVRHGKNVFEYSEIIDGIFIGTNQCCQMHFSKDLLKKGITADVSLEIERLDAPHGVDYYLWLPVKNHLPPSQRQFDIGVEFLKDLVARKVNVFVHCERGHGRAPTLVAAYLVSKGMALKEAVALIKKKRPAIHPNKKQLAGVLEFARRWKNGEAFAAMACVGR